MAHVIVGHPDADFSGYLRVAGRGLLFTQGFTELVDLTAAQQTELTSTGFTVNGQPDPPVPDPFPQYLTPTRAGAAIGAAGNPLGDAARAAFVPKVTPEQFGAKGDGTTDDTAAIQAAHDYLEANGGGVLTFGNKTYLVNSAPRTDRGGNSIIAFGQYPTTSGPSVVWEGVSPQENYWPGVNRGTVIRTTRTTDTYSATYGPPSVLGGQTRENTDPAVIDPFSYMQIAIHNIAIRVPHNPSIAGVDLRYIGRMDWNGSIVIADTPDDPTSGPTHTWAFGLRTPGKQNWNKSLMGSGGAYGFYVGLVPEEHLIAQYWSHKWCVIGMGLQGAGSNHAFSFKKLDSEWCVRHISGWSETVGAIPLPNPMWLTVDLFDIEDSPTAGMYAGSGGWFETVYHVNDPANKLFGKMDYIRQEDGVGNRNVLLLNGAKYLETRPITAQRQAIGKQVVVDLFASPISSVGSWLTAPNSNAFYGATTYNGSNTQHDSITFLIELEEGTYMMDLFVLMDSYCGIVTLKLDGATSTLADLYAASSTPARISFGGAFPGGTHEITFAMDTKNASSSGYVGFLSKLILTKTA